MGDYENKIREAIKARYGSVPKMAEATGIPTNTIYHALERGLDNTTTRTRRLILDALDCAEQEQQSCTLTTDERELLTLYRTMDKRHQEMLMETARSFAALSVKDGDGITEDVERIGIAIAKE